MTADELLADPIAGVALPDGAVPVTAIVVIEYVEPASENRPERRRLGWRASDELNPWTSIGIWEFLKQHEIVNISGFVEDAGDDS